MAPFAGWGGCASWLQFTERFTEMVFTVSVSADSSFGLWGYWGLFLWFSDFNNEDVGWGFQVVPGAGHFNFGRIWHGFFSTVSSDQHRLAIRVAASTLQRRG